MLCTMYMLSTKYKIKEYILFFKKVLYLTHMHHASHINIQTIDYILVNRKRIKYENYNEKCECMNECII